MRTRERVPGSAHVEYIHICGVSPLSFTPATLHPTRRSSRSVSTDRMPLRAHLEQTFVGEFPSPTNDPLPSFPSFLCSISLSLSHPPHAVRTHMNESDLHRYHKRVAAGISSKSTNHRGKQNTPRKAHPQTQLHNQWDTAQRMAENSANRHDRTDRRRCCAVASGRRKTPKYQPRPADDRSTKSDTQ